MIIVCISLLDRKTDHNRYYHQIYDEHFFIGKTLPIELHLHFTTSELRQSVWMQVGDYSNV
ncbi:hypothetical protein [Lacticaseibacillus paracasei]|uniref:hypothetical protein n=1 Tax=Lacticaseibacillus paracasei TaxID=1597 RepID=UPI00195944E7|nr:hypothetical protein [Lacticaseibacillus paracasei]